jgi:phosphoribosylformimino-5-aminoimidazole carboxamide ribotide isomerase
MQVIPVIDLKGGLVVHARRGERDRYRPIDTPLAAGSAPVDVARGLLSVHPFRTLYIADLDAITRQGDNQAVIRQLRAQLPGVRLWVDNGIADRAAAEAWLAHDLGDLVIGSEAQADAALMRQFQDDARAVLSLDFRDAALGPRELLEPVCWPQRVIVMTLARVGSGAGPDLDRLRAVRAAAGSRAIFAAGGVRNRHDLVALKQAGIAGALVASALHAEQLCGAEIEALQGAGS